MCDRRQRNILTEIIFVVLFFLVFPALGARDVQTLPVTYVFNIGMDLVGLAVVTIFYTNTFDDAYQEAKGSKTFPWLLVVEYVALYSDLFAWVVDGVPGLAWANVLDNTVFYFCHAFLGFAFLNFVQDYFGFETKLSRNIQVMSIVGILETALLLLLNLPFGFVFSVDAANVYSRGILYPLTFIYPVCVLIATAVVILRHSTVKGITKWSLFLFCFVPILGAAIQTFTYGISFIYILVLFFLILMFALTYMRRGMDLVETRTAAKEMSLKLEEQRQLILLSQIHPKYIVSTLSTISSLVKENPEEAYRLTLDFSDYLRHNLDSLSGNQMETFRDELAQIEKYAAIEEKRLGERAFVMYDVGPIDFPVPVLSIQPIVENAVSRGLEEFRSLIYVWVRTYEDDEHFFIDVEDNSITGNLKRLETSQEMRNIKARLEGLSHATVSYFMNAGKGITVTVRIPK